MSKKKNWKKKQFQFRCWVNSSDVIEFNITATKYDIEFVPTFKEYDKDSKVIYMDNDETMKLMYMLLNCFKIDHYEKTF